MNARFVADNLRRTADDLEQEAAKLREAATMLDAIKPAPSAYVVELARMLRAHGLCVVERGAIKVALDAMDALRHVDLDGDDDLTAQSYDKARNAVSEAVQGSYPALPEVAP